MTLLFPRASAALGSALISTSNTCLFVFSVVIYQLLLSPSASLASPTFDHAKKSITDESKEEDACFFDVSLIYLLILFIVELAE